MGFLDCVALFCMIAAPALFPIYAAWVYALENNERKNGEVK